MVSTRFNEFAAISQVSLVSNGQYEPKFEHFPPITIAYGEDVEASPVVGVMAIFSDVESTGVVSAEDVGPSVV
jgi:hypothetical protein